MSNNVILSVHANLIEVEREEICHSCKTRKSEVLLHNKRLCFGCAYIELGIDLNTRQGQLDLGLVTDLSQGQLAIQG